jgi:hypothetical protein
MVRPTFIIASIMICGCGGNDSAQTFQGEAILGGDGVNVVADKIDRAGLPAVFLTSNDGSVELGIFQAKTEKPYLTLRDSDGDGVFDLLTYNSLSEFGEVLVEVEDYGMDGQPDLIVNHAERKASVFYRGYWHSVSGVGTGQPASIEIDGQLLRLEDVLDERGRNAY